MTIFLAICYTFVCGLALGGMFLVLWQLQKQEDYLKQIKFNTKQIYRILRDCQKTTIVKVRRDLSLRTITKHERYYKYLFLTPFL